MRDGDFACATFVHQVHSGGVWFKALRTGTNELKIEACCQAYPRVRDVVAIPNIYDLQMEVQDEDGCLEMQTICHNIGGTFQDTLKTDVTIAADACCQKIIL